jgi:penicillin-binding protein 1A
LAKTIFLTRKRTLDRKFKELLLTLQIEKQYSKDEILELYLNQVYFGGGAYGVESAAKLYFDKHAQEMNLAECALLAGLVQSPNRYSPLKNPEAAKRRRSHVLRRLLALNFITPVEAEEADKVPIQTGTAGRRIKEAPYFLEEVRKTLEPKYGEEALDQGGLVIQTTLDLRMQQAAQEMIDRHLAAFDVKYGTATLIEYNKAHKGKNGVDVSTTPPKIQGALVAIDVHTGAIRALVGGRDFYTSQFNRAFQAKRQPGSSFKPFVWAAAMEHGFTAATVINDAPVVYSDVDSHPKLLGETTTFAQTEGVIMADIGLTTKEFGRLSAEKRKKFMQRYYRPQNYDFKFLGPITLRKALAKSRNIISIKLMEKVGPQVVADFAHKAGIDSRLDAVLSLGLGTSVVNLLELVSAYGTFANGGLLAHPYFIERVADRYGKTLEETQPMIESRLDPQTAYLATSLLQAVVNQGTGWYAKRLGRPLAGKTGTTQDQRDLLFVGYSPDLVCGVWVGYDDFRPLKKGISASTVAVPLWVDFMREALKSMPVKDFSVPAKIEFAKIDMDTGYLALPTCPHVLLEAFLEGTVPTEFCPTSHLTETPIDEPVDE